VVEAILRSARMLIAARGPGVALREIADNAGVNFGLLYHYFGTKDQLIDEVYAEATRVAAARLAESAHIEDALAMLMASGDGTTARLIGWAVLGGREEAEIFGHSPALEVLTSRLRTDAAARGTHLRDEDARVFTAFAMVTALGWRLFGTTALLAAGLEGVNPETYRGLVLSYLEVLARTAVETSRLRPEAGTSPADGATAQPKSARKPRRAAT
jgi:TetR/AcrR family transcriptional regulator, repressor for neighboring sulfatase